MQTPPSRTGMSQPRDTEEGPPRTEGVVPLPRSERGGSGEAAQGERSITAAPAWPASGPKS
ncbi:hypothetical protein CTI10_011065 [Delftia acidovorans]|nr:hypothetical protein CTI10_011065 [Delftia acidovorans]